MEKYETNIKDAYIIEYKSHIDYRGQFAEVFNKREFDKLELDSYFVQDNISWSRKNVIRGLHFQPGQIKMVQCIKGAIIDCIIDMRKFSSTYGEKFSITLKEGDNKWLYIPSMCAHGFQALEENTAVHYKVSVFHNPNIEGGVNLKNYDLPWTISLDDAIISKKDQML